MQCLPARRMSWARLRSCHLESGLIVTLSRSQLRQPPSHILTTRLGRHQADAALAAQDRSKYPRHYASSKSKGSGRLDDRHGVRTNTNEHCD